MSFRRDQDIGHYTDDMTIAEAVALLLAALGGIATAIATLDLEVGTSADRMIAEMELGKEWNWELAQVLIDRVKDVRTACIAAGINTVTELGTFHAEFATLGTIITAQTALVVTELSNVQTAVSDSGDRVVAKLQDGQEWDTVLTQELIEKMETIRAANIAVGTDLGTRLTALHTLTQLASDLGIAQGADILAELQAVGVSAVAVNHVLDTSLETLEKLLRMSEVTAGEELEEGD